MFTVNEIQEKFFDRKSKFLLHSSNNAKEAHINHTQVSVSDLKFLYHQFLYQTFSSWWWDDQNVREEKWKSHVQVYLINLISHLAGEVTILFSYCAIAGNCTQGMIW